MTTGKNRKPIIKKCNRLLTNTMDEFFSGVDRGINQAIDQGTKAVSQTIDKSGKAIGRFGDKIAQDQTVKNITKDVVQTSKDVGKFGRDKGDEVSKLGGTISGIGVATGQPELVAAGAAVGATGQGLKKYGEVGQQTKNITRR